MATIISHPLVPVVIAVVVGSGQVPWRLLMLGVLVSVLPDTDVLAFRLGVPYADPLGHRGFTHSLAAALLIALVATPFASLLRATAATTFAFVFCSMASHGVLDALTQQGLGVAFFWPFDDARYFFPFHPVETSPITVARFQVRAIEVLQSELRWLWLPLFAIALLGAGLRKAIRGNASTVERHLLQRMRRAHSIKP